MRPSSMLSVAVAATAAALMITLVQPAPRASAAGLDRIDAAGVTEQGGSAAYARMLVRTGTNGVLAASLLPPLADWASQPVPGLYYAAGGAASQGNGSPQWPFNTLTYALAHMERPSALVLAPAAYSGTLSLASGESVTLIGAGPGSRVALLSVSVEGTSSATCLSLVGLDVGTLAVSGGRVNVRLANSTITRLEGTSSNVTVTRTDLGSYVSLATLSAADVYTGYDTVPQAEALVDAETGGQLTLSGGRATVDDGAAAHTVAYLSDIEASTNGLDAAIRDLRAEGAALQTNISAEATARAAGDTALSNRLDGVKASLEAQVAAVSTAWGGRLSTVSTAIGELRDAIQACRTTESNDIAAVNAALSAVSTAYAAADTAIRADLAALEDRVGDMTDNLDGTIDSRARVVADSRIVAATERIVTNAVTRANAHSDTAVAALSGTVAANQSANTTRMAEIESSVNSVKSTLNTLIASLANARSPQYGSLTNSYRITLPAPLP